MAFHSALVTVDTLDHCVTSVMMVTMETRQQSLACPVIAMGTLTLLFQGPATLLQESA